MPTFVWYIIEDPQGKMFDIYSYEWVDTLKPGCFFLTTEDAQKVIDWLRLRRLFLAAVTPVELTPIRRGDI